MKRRISRPVGLSATRRADSDTTDRGRGAQTTRMGDMAAMAARYETLQEDEVIVPSSKGHTDASAAAMMKKWGKNEIPEEKEPLGGVCTVVRAVFSRDAQACATSCVAYRSSWPKLCPASPPLPS